jgi:hypothetical protein
MPSAQTLQSELHHYLILGDQLKAQYADIDDETLRDTLEGISDLPPLIEQVVRSALEDEVLIGALKIRIGEMGERLERFKLRAEKKRALVCRTMGAAGIDRLQAEDFSVSLRSGAQRLEIVDEGQIPDEFLIPQPPRLDRTGLLNRLKAGQGVRGAALGYGEPHITVRVK